MKTSRPAAHTPQAPEQLDSAARGLPESEIQAWQAWQVRAEKLPVWAPASVVEMWRKETDAAIDGYRNRWNATGDPQLVAEFRERAFGIPGLLRRLLRDPRMGEVWPHVSQKGLGDQDEVLRAVRAFEPGASGSDVQAWLFASAIVRGWMGPWKEERWTRAERARWQRNVAAAAMSLKSSIQGTDAEEILQRVRSNRAMNLAMRVRREKAQGTDAEEILRLAHSMGEDDGLTLLDLLDGLTHHAGELIPPSILPRPHGREAQRAYFVRVLTAHCKAYLGGPRGRLVALSGQIALKDEALDERQVSRLTRRPTT